MFSKIAFSLLLAKSITPFVVAQEIPFDTVYISQGTNVVNSRLNCDLFSLSSSNTFSTPFLIGRTPVSENQELNSFGFTLNIDKVNFPDVYTHRCASFGFCVSFTNTNISLGRLGCVVSANGVSDSPDISDIFVPSKRLPYSGSDSVTYGIAGAYYNSDAEIEPCPFFKYSEVGVSSENLNQILEINIQYSYTDANLVGKYLYFCFCPYWNFGSFGSSVGFHYDMTEYAYAMSAYFDGFLGAFANGFETGYDLQRYLLGNQTQDSYNQGFSDGNQKGYTNGYNAGLVVANKSYYDKGYNDGFNKGSSTGTPASIILSIFGAVADVPIKILNGFAGFTIWDVSLLAILSTLMFLALILWIIKKVI